MAVSPTGKALRNKELRDLFNKIWSENISSVLPPTLPTIDGPDIDIKLEKIFLEHFKQHPNIVNIIRYHDTKKTFSINYSKHVMTSQKFMDPLQKHVKNIRKKTTVQIMKLIKSFT